MISRRYIALFIAAWLTFCPASIAEARVPEPGSMAPPPEQLSAPESYDALCTFSEPDTEESEKLYKSTAPDEVAVLVTAGKSVLDSTDIVRDSDSSTGGDAASFYGIGVAVLCTGGEIDIVNGSSISTDADGGAGVFAYADGTVRIENSNIVTQRGCSGAIHVAGGGTLYAMDVDAETHGESSAAIRSDRGGGLIVVDGGEYDSYGTGSPAVYSTATIVVNDATLEAHGSEAVCIEGKNALYLYDCDLSGNMPDSEQNDCTWNVILYQSMSGDSEIGESVFQMDGGTLSAGNGSMFYTTNTTAVFVLCSVDITYSDDNPFLLRCTGNANARGWGQPGMNGARCTFTGIAQELCGNVAWDSISELDIYLTEGSTLTGAFVQDESCAGDGGNGYATLTIDESSRWIITGDSVLTSLHNAGTVVDEAGDAVTIQGTDGTVYVQGAGEHTITVSVYDTEADLSDAGSITPFEDAQVNNGSEDVVLQMGGVGGIPGGTLPERPGGTGTPPEKPDGGFLRNPGDRP